MNRILAKEMTDDERKEKKSFFSTLRDSCIKFIAPLRRR
jgi:hypothetical protein